MTKRLPPEPESNKAMLQWLLLDDEGHVSSPPLQPNGCGNGNGLRKAFQAKRNLGPWLLAGSGTGKDYVPTSQRLQMELTLDRSQR